MTAVLDHYALLTLARRAHGLAADRDDRRCREMVARLVGELERHVESERVVLEALPAHQTRALRRGRRDLARLAVELSDASASGRMSRCEALLSQLIAELVVVGNEERRTITNVELN